MFLFANRNIILPSDDGQTYFLKKGYIGNVPEQFCSGTYFQELVKCGKISIPESSQDRDMQKSEETAEDTLKKEIKRTQKGRRKPQGE